MRVVLDTNILVAGLHSRQGASHALLGQVLARRLQIVAAPALWLEYEDVLKRPDIQHMHRLSNQEIDFFLDALSILVEPVSMNYLWRPQLRDPKDEIFLETALNAGVDALVTFNQRDFQPAADNFRLPLLFPAACLARLEKTP
ncbi:MAG: putative toxin-antitoxin system toxin component, PIN family [Desulfovibrionaceae bacterium]|jgi:putative PIN family toxin of toxin-antitoxin system|nr:putative toxin-antitoxin system toxin component, PIN family [Desulfovibrionaceae bacterium]